MQNNKPYKHLDEITCLFSYAILLVEIGHSRITNYRQANPEFYWYIWSLIYSFHMHLFMFVSGFLFIYTNIKGEKLLYGKFILKKIKRLMIPYLLLMSLAFLIRLLLYDYVKKKLQLSDFFYMFIDPSFAAIGYFWFIFTLFIVFCFAPIFFISLKKKSLISVIVITIVLVYFNLNPIKIQYFYLHKISEYFLFFWFGCCFYMLRDKLYFLINNYLSVIIMLAALICLDALQQKSLLLDMLKALSGIFFSYALIQIYIKKGCNFLNVLNGYYYQIFLLSWFFHKGAEFFLYYLAGLGFYFVFPISFLCSLFCSIGIAKMIKNHVPALKFIVGLKT